MRKNNLAFTLVELLISISIIALLTVTASIAFSKAQRNGRDIKRKEDLKAVQNAAEQYYLLNNSNYPDGISMPWQGDGGQIILQDFPSNPKGDAYNIVDMDDDSYCICVAMENGKGNSTGVSCNSLSETDGDYFCVRNQQ